MTNSTQPKRHIADSEPRLGQHGLMETDRNRWDRRYAESTLATPQAPDVVAIWPELDEILPTSGSALDLACGTGSQSLWLAARGLDVSSVDVSPRAIALVSAAAVELCFGHNIDASVIDTDDGLPDDATELAIIICQRYRVPELYADLVARLSSGGILCLTVLSAVGLDGDAGPFHAPPGELTSAFGAMAGAEIIRDVEGDGAASVVVRRRDD